MVQSFRSLIGSLVWQRLPRQLIVQFIPAIFLTGLLLLTGCRNEASDPTAIIDLDSLPVSVPESVLTVDSIDTILFATLYPFSVPLDDGSVLIADVRHRQVYHLNPDGTGRVVVDNGRGPGEVQFVNTLSPDPDGSIYLYDRDNTRVTKFGQNLAYDREFMLEKTEEEVVLRWIYPTADTKLFLVSGIDMRFYQELDPNPVRVVGLYHPEEGSYSDWIRVPYWRVAFTVIDGIIRAERIIPYTPRTHVSMHPEGRSFYLYWPPSNKIAELSLSMDTLRVIPVILPEERFINSEQDSLLDQQDFIDTAERRNMRSQLPEVKTPADRFLVDDLGQFWLRLTRRSSVQEWLVLDKKGTQKRIVQLPKEVEVTHVSSQNIGVLEEDMATFSLYELGD